VRNDVIHEVLSNRLRSLVEQVSLSLSDLFEAGSFFDFSDLSNLRFFFVSAFFLLGFLFAGKSFLFFTFDKSTDFILFLTFDDFLGLLIFSRCLTFLFRSSLFDCCFGSELSFFDFSLFVLLEVCKEFVISISNQVEAAWFSVTFAECHQVCNSFGHILEIIRAI